MRSAAHRLRQGRVAEDEARTFLEKQGLKTLARNYRVARGEIDLVMEDRAVVVFVEVRSRTSDDFVPAIETIDRRKQGRIVHASRHYLQDRKLTDKVDCRFDVVVITGSAGARRIEWVKSAFEV